MFDSTDGCTIYTWPASKLECCATTTNNCGTVQTLMIVETTNLSIVISLVVTLRLPNVFHFPHFLSAILRSCRKQMPRNTIVDLIAFPVSFSMIDTSFSLSPTVTIHQIPGMSRVSFSQSPLFPPIFLCVSPFRVAEFHLITRNLRLSY